MRRRIAALMALATVPTAFALATTSPKPAGGKWKAVASDSGGSKGGFSFNKAKTSIGGFHVTPGTASSSACGTTAFKVKGRQKLAKATRGGYTVWIIGKNAPKTHDGAIGAAVSITQSGVTKKGKLKIFFQSSKFGDGELDYGQCLLNITATK